MGSEPKIEAQPVNATETTREAIDAQLEALPRIVSAQREFAPELAGIDVGLLQEFLPQLSELGRELQAEDLQFQREQFPETAAGQEQITEFLGGADLAGERQRISTDITSALDEFLSGADPLTAEQTRGVREDVRSAQIARGQERFGFGATAEARTLEDLRRQLRTDRLNARLTGAQSLGNLNLQGINAALSTTGRVPVSGGQNIGFNSPGQLVEGPTVGQFLSTAQSNAQLAQNASIFNAGQVNPFGSLLGSIAGTTGAGFGLKAAGAFN